MKKLLRIAAAGALGLSLTTGIVSAQSGTIDTTGPESVNEIIFEDVTDVVLENTTDVAADVQKDQTATTGDAKVKKNTTGEDAETGDASNEAEVEADLEIDNSGSSAAALECACEGGGGHEASIENTGPWSENVVEFANETNVEVTNETNVAFNEDVTQEATSGDATVFGNTTGGGASTGDASNSSTTVFSLSVTN